MRFAFVLILLAGCFGDNIPRSTVDATPATVDALPSCHSLGCDGNLFCTRLGVCLCKPPGATQAMQCESTPPDAAP